MDDILFHTHYAQSCTQIPSSFHFHTLILNKPISHFLRIIFFFYQFDGIPCIYYNHQNFYDSVPSIYLPYIHSLYIDVLIFLSFQNNLLYLLFHSKFLHYFYFQQIYSNYLIIKGTNLQIIKTKFYFRFNVRIIFVAMVDLFS